MQDWLVLSIGNSRLHWGWFSDEILQRAWDTPHLDGATIQRLIVSQWNFQRCQLIPKDLALPTWIEAPELWLLSVVPHQTQFWKQYPKIHPIALSQIPIAGLYEGLGCDRAVALWGAIQTYGSPALVIDCGTALTFTGVDDRQRFAGGAILPGLQLQLRSLGQATAALPNLDSKSLKLPPRWAKNTAHAIQSGILYSAIASIHQFVQDWLQTFPNSHILMTGGDSGLLWQIMQTLEPATSTLPDLLPVSKIQQDPHLAFWGVRSLRYPSHSKTVPSKIR
ncbi:MAG: pantothenate kinase [Synechococcales bacterium]|nr:pantothenate kinase [Synechococcales bacterium]